MVYLLTPILHQLVHQIEHIVQLRLPTPRVKGAGCVLIMKNPPLPSYEGERRPCGVATHVMIRLTIDQHCRAPVVIEFFLANSGLIERAIAQRSTAS